MTKNRFQNFQGSCGAHHISYTTSTPPPRYFTGVKWYRREVQLGYLEVTVHEKLRSGWPGPFVKVEGCCDQPLVCFQCEQTSQVELQKHSSLYCIPLHTCRHSGALRATTRTSPTPHRRTVTFHTRALQLGYLEVTVQEKLRSGWPGPFVKVEGCCD
jgi:hypothetical protein